MTRKASVRALLVHNPAAGRGVPDRAALEAALRRQGYEPLYVDRKADGWREELTRASELIVVAGGDGTFDKVARSVAGDDRGLLVLPFGTANNVARAVGLVDLGGLQPFSRYRPAPFDRGAIEAPWGTDIFFEAAGVGVIAELMPVLSALKEDRHQEWEEAAGQLGFDRAALVAAIRDQPVRRIAVRLDGRNRSGDYLLVEAMNIAGLGPQVTLAPEADPGDGRLDVVLVGEKQRRTLTEYVERLRDGRDTAPPQLPVERARVIEIGWAGELVHADSHVYGVDDRLPKSRSVEAPAGVLRISVEPAVVRVLVPA